MKKNAMLVPLHEPVSFDRRDHPGGTNMSGMTFHLGYELYFLISGRKRYIVAGQTIDFEAPAVILIRPAALHTVLSMTDEPHKMAVLLFGENYLERYSDVLSSTILGQNIAAALFRPDLDFILRLSEDMLRLQNHKSPMGAAAVQARVFLAICELSVMTPELTVDFGANASEERVAVRILGYIEEHLASPVNLAGTAKKFGYSPDEMTRLLKRCTGNGWRWHIGKLRLGAALRMLAFEDMSVADIAEKCGFSNPNYFGDFILDRTGVSPSEYRRRYAGTLNESDPLPLFEC